MIIEIANDYLKVAINRLGAELHSLRSTPAGEEYLWQGKQDVWSGRAPILFPVVGALKHTPSYFGNKAVSLPKHGFARHSEFELTDRSPSELKLILCSDDNTLSQYPWPFELHVHFKLVGNSLSTLYSVKNLGREPMPFNIGSHPAFALDLTNNTHQDYRIEFSDKENLAVYAVSEEGLLRTNPEEYDLDDQGITLTPNLFNQDALVFKHINSRQLHLVEKTRGRRVSVDTGGAPHLGIWAKPGSEFVCIEPWWGHADFDSADEKLESKSSLQTLPAGGTFETGIQISI